MELNDEKLMQQIRTMEYPVKADIVDSVMRRIEQQTAKPKKPRLMMWQRYTIAAAACVALAIMVNLVIYFTKDYNEPQICDMFASAYGGNQYDIASFDVDDMAYFGYYGEE